MHDIDIVTIWFYSVSAGVLLTLLMTQLASAPGRNNAETVQLAQDVGDESTAALVHRGSRADVSLVSTSWTWDRPHAATDQAAIGQNQARLMVPSSEQRAYAFGRDSTEAGDQCEEREEEYKELVTNHEGS